MRKAFVLLPVVCLLVSGSSATAQERVGRLVVRGATLVDGTGAPARGPVDIVVENGVISDIVPADPVGMGREGDRPTGDRVIDASSMYVLPGLIDMHVHIPDASTAWGPDYAYKLWLAHGITTVRDAGCFGGFEMVKAHRAESAEGSRVAPRIFAYRIFPFGSKLDEEGARSTVREYKESGADGIKLPGVYPDLLAAIGDEARKVDLPIMQHNSIDARGAATGVLSARAGITSVEHWYGVPEAAIPGGQHLPLDYNELKELDRFRWAGRLWQEVDWERMDKALEEMVEKGIAWDPTFSVYETNRDLLRARHLPWHADYTHPLLYQFWEPNPQNHGSYHTEWTTMDEAAWREDMRLWMEAVRRFARLGGVVTTGADAGAAYHLFGFGFVRELEMHVEAGFRPLETIRHATADAAKVLGFSKAGQVRVGYTADLVLVEGNPIADLKRLYGDFGSGGVRWTIKEGRIYDAPALLREVKEQVRRARASTTN
jgi:imidazolonepropionase-like amidohydrolase